MTRPQTLPPGSTEPVAAKAIDRDHLARYTLGDSALEHEILDLFATQVVKLLSAVVDAESQSEWRFATHSIKGSARAVGAWDLAATAERLEAMQPGDAATADEIAQLIAAVKDAVAAASAPL
ncbi:MAG: Hpt domain-containing protein [Pseudomonadota bacterium]